MRDISTKGHRREAVARGVLLGPARRALLAGRVHGRFTRGAKAELGEALARVV